MIQRVYLLMYQIAKRALQACTALFLTALALPVMADSSGSGFVINRYWVMTNDHVVEGCSRIEVQGYGTALDILRDPDSDLAVIRLAIPNDGPVLSFRTTRPRLAENIHVLGYPLSGVLSSSVRVTSGTVSSLTAFSEGDGLIQISAPVQPGNSGGPVIDDRGYVVGVTVGILNVTGSQNVNFAISGEVAQDFLGVRAITYSEAVSTDGDQSAASLPDVIERAAAATVPVICFGPGTRPRANPRPQSAVSAEMVSVRGRDVIGYDYMFLRDMTLPSCRAACENDQRCQAYTFNSRHNVCFLKDNATLLVTNSDAISGYSSQLAASLSDTGFTVIADADSPGGDYRRIRRSNFLSCLAECGLDARCRAFAFVRESGDCWMKNIVGSVGQMQGVEFGLR